MTTKHLPQTQNDSDAAPNSFSKTNDTNLELSQEIKKLNEAKILLAETNSKSEFEDKLTKIIENV